MVPKLAPIHGDGETLRSEIKQRGDIQLSAAPLILGKNAATGIADSDLKRKMVRIRAFSNENIQIEALDEDSASRTLVNGTAIAVEPVSKLNHGDVLSLSSSNTSYSYRVFSTAISALSSSPAKRQREKSPATNTSKKITEEVTCPICLELMVHATILVSSQAAFMLFSRLNLPATESLWSHGL